jgi:prepilin-type N-terminal cleavage/methylation domain-containing protein
MRRRGYTLLEMIVVLTLLSIALAGAGFAYVAIAGNVDAANAENTVNGVLAAQQERYSTRTAYTDDLERLADMNPDVAFVAVAGNETQVSVAVGTVDGTDAVAATARSGDRCVAGVAVDPRVATTPAEVSWERTDAQRCTGSEAFVQIGDRELSSW